MAADSSVASDASSRVRVANTLLVAVVLILLVQLAWQQFRIGRLENAAEQSQRALSSSVERIANDRLKGLRREELAATMQWLDEFYRSADGLQRPGGLWRADINAPDSEAIAVWIFDVYLQARLSGKSDAEAREIVIGQIKSTDEWRRKHPQA
jgi:hypothetical protein